MIDQILLTRIGIILSAIGGFLVAPELIGIKRIQELQDWLANLSRDIFSMLSTAHGWALSDALPRSSSGITKGSRYLLLILISLISIILAVEKLGFIKIGWHIQFPSWVIWLLLIFVAPITVFIVNIENGSGKLDIPTKKKSLLNSLGFLIEFIKFLTELIGFFVEIVLIFLVLDWLSVFGLIGVLIVLLLLTVSQPTISLLYLLGLPFWLLLATVLLIASIPLGKVAQVLSGKQRLQHILVRLGLLMILVGTVIQVLTAE